MAKAPLILDMTRLPKKTREEIFSVGGDPDFVEFVLAWHGVIGGEQIPFDVRSPSQTVIRRTKRRLNRYWGKIDAGEWKKILCAWRDRPKARLQKTLFKLEPKTDNPPHRPRDEGKWTAVCDLRNYFKGVTGHFEMSLIQECLGLERDYSTFNPEWERRKSWFDETEANTRLEQLTTFYHSHRDSICESLQTGIPLYDRIFSTKSSEP